MSQPGDELRRDDDAVTAEIPVVDGPARTREGVLLWVIAGGLIGLVAVVIFGGGLRRTPASPPSTTAGTTTTTPLPTATVPSPTTTGPSRAAAAPLTLEISPVAGEAIAVEVRRGGPRGFVRYAGTIPDGGTRTIIEPTATPLWLSLAWAPSAVVRINGQVVPTPGGTEAYLVRASGLTRITGGASTTTKSR